MDAKEDYSTLIRKTGHGKKLFEQDYTLNTIVTPQSEKAYVSCYHGFWIIDLKNGNNSIFPYWKQRKDSSFRPKSAPSFRMLRADCGSAHSIGDCSIITPCHAQTAERQPYFFPRITGRGCNRRSLCGRRRPPHLSEKSF